MRVILDTNIIGKLCHPNNTKNKSFIENFISILESGEVEVYLPEISDYELRRKILHKLAKDTSWKITLERLDALRVTLSFLTIDSDVFKQAAQFWANAKGSGTQTSPDAALDGDSILAAQAVSVGGMVVTENEKHLSLFVDTLNPQKFIEEASRVIEASN